MIFFTAGTQLPFERLLRIALHIASIEDCEIICQIIGATDNQLLKNLPQNFTSKNVIPRDEYLEILERSSVIISHAGMGTIISAAAVGKKPIIVPRQCKLGEHRNDHQMDIVNYLESELGLVVAHNQQSVQTAVAQHIQKRTAENSPIKEPTDLSSSIRRKSLVAYLQQQLEQIK